MPPKTAPPTQPPGQGIPVYDAATDFFGMSLQTGGFVTMEDFVGFFRGEFPDVPTSQLRRIYQEEMQFWMPVAIAVERGDRDYLASILWPDRLDYRQSALAEAFTIVGSIIQDIVDSALTPPPPPPPPPLLVTSDGKQAQDTTGGVTRPRQTWHDDPAPQYYYQYYP